MSGAASNERDFDALRPQVRIGAAIRLHGGASVTVVDAAPGARDSSRWQPLTRTCEEADLVEAGLFRQRAFDVVEQGEEAVIERALHVREELRVTRRTTARVERIDATVRSAEAEIESIAPSDAPLGDIVRRRRDERQERLS